MSDEGTPAAPAGAHDRVDPAPDDGAEDIAGTAAAPVVPDPDIGGAVLAAPTDPDSDAAEADD